MVEKAVPEGAEYSVIHFATAFYEEVEGEERKKVIDDGIREVIETIRQNEKLKFPHTMPCGQIVSQEDLIAALERRENLQCPCGNPKHHLVQIEIQG